MGDQLSHSLSSLAYILIIILSTLRVTYCPANTVKIQIPEPAVALFLARKGTFLQLQHAEPQRSLARVPLVPGLARLHHAPDQHPGKRVEESMITVMSQIENIFKVLFGNYGKG